MVQSLVEEEDSEEIKGTLNALSVLDWVTPEDIAEEQCKDPILGVVCPYVTIREILKSLAISKIKLKALRKYLWQLARLSFKQGDLHCLYTNNDVEYYQMILPIMYHVQVLQMLHNGQVIKVWNKPLPCAGNAFIGIQCTRMLLNM